MPTQIIVASTSPGRSEPPIVYPLVFSYPDTFGYLKNEQNPLKILNYFSYYSGEESIRGISLAYKAVTRHHSGIYICQADNGFGEPSQANLKLDVQRKFVHTFF